MAPGQGVVGQRRDARSVADLPGLRHGDAARGNYLKDRQRDESQGQRNREDAMHTPLTMRRGGSWILLRAPARLFGVKSFPTLAHRRTANPQASNRHTVALHG